MAWEYSCEVVLHVGDKAARGAYDKRTLSVQAMFQNGPSGLRPEQLKSPRYMEALRDKKSLI